ncbi:MAG: uroporphyrinogen decarboxylase [Planctomycetota bacterium]|jgi:uroporphyrinogen decarboxylase
MTVKKAAPEAPFLAAARGKKPEHRPTWIMRQAGRYLPEYRALREELSFVELCGTPSAAAEATLQPIRRYDMDAAILFTDLLIPVEAMGVGLRYAPGPILSKTIHNFEDVESLEVVDPERDLNSMLATATEVRGKLDESKALIGFVGAPFTLSCYLIEGKGSKNWETTRRMIYERPEVFAALQEKLTDCLLPLIPALVASGCDAIQVFDSWAGVLDPDCYNQFCATQTNRLLSAARESGALSISFATGSPQHLENMLDAPADVLAIDWRLPMATARETAPGRCLQGNLDPCALFAGQDSIRERVQAICNAAGPSNHIFNLGHGILPPTDPSALEIAVQTARST